MQGIIICHKNLGFELLNTARAIMGHADELTAFTNHNTTPEGLLGQINEYLNGSGENEDVFVFVDLRGGNCWRIARMMMHENEKIRVISGVNLPMLLSFLTKKETMTVKELAEILETDGHRGIILEN